MRPRRRRRTTSTASPMSRAPARCATCAAGSRTAQMRETAPGPWLRATALAGAAGCLLAVVSGTAGWGTAHRVLAALALPPLIAVVIAAWTTHRRLLTPAVTSVGVFA